jgi:hypothetical protein
MRLYPSHIQTASSHPRIFYMTLSLLRKHSSFTFLSTTEMSYTSSHCSTPSSSLSSSTKSIPIRFSVAGVETLSTPTSRSSHSQYTPYGSSLARSNSRPNAYVSDEDLFGSEDAYLLEAPSPPRPAEVWAVAQPLLPPVMETRRRRSSGQKEKHRKSSLSKK